MQAEVKIILGVLFILYIVFIIVTTYRVLEAVAKNIDNQVKYFDNNKRDCNGYSKSYKKRMF